MVIVKKTLVLSRCYLSKKCWLSISNISSQYKGVKPTFKLTLKSAYTQYTKKCTISIQSSKFTKNTQMPLWIIIYSFFKQTWKHAYFATSLSVFYIWSEKGKRSSRIRANVVWMNTFFLYSALDILLTIFWDKFY